MRAVTLSESGTTCTYYCSQRVNRSLKPVKLPSASRAVNVPILPLRHSPRSLQLSCAGICSFLLSRSPLFPVHLTLRAYSFRFTSASQKTGKISRRDHEMLRKCAGTKKRPEYCRSSRFLNLRFAVVPAMTAGTCALFSGALPGWVRGRDALRGGAGPRRWRDPAAGLCC